MAAGRYLCCSWEVREGPPSRDPLLPGLFKGQVLGGAGWAAGVSKGQPTAVQLAPEPLPWSEREIDHNKGQVSEFRNFGYVQF